MVRNAYTRIALSGAVWFALVACICFPLPLRVLLVPLSPDSPYAITNPFIVSLVIYGVPASIVGFTLANRIANSPRRILVFGFGVALVVGINLLAGVVITPFAAQIDSLESFVEKAALGAAAFLSVGIEVFNGVPFLIGGLAALAFRAGIQYMGWAENEF